MKKSTSEDSQRFIAIPYSKKYNRFVKKIKKNSRYALRIVERDTLEAKLYFNYRLKKKVLGKRN